MAEPVSSVTYAMEAALGGLDGDLGSLFPTMALVIGVTALVAAGSHGLLARVPNGGSDAKGLAAAFGEGWAFLPLGALLASTVLSRRERRPFATAIAAGGTLAVAVVLVLNLRRLDPILSLGTAAIVSVYLWRSWVAHGRPGGIPSVAT